ncbi:hypothetical protein [Streptomyces sp. B21-105]|uniref:hypothetical protein n=1 Tax=Streptomyces sp. B21-105 TaxID=3039417 RepID=UPI003FA7CB27
MTGLGRQQRGGLEQASPVAQCGEPGGVGRLIAVTGRRAGPAGAAGVKVVQWPAGSGANQEWQPVGV